MTKKWIAINILLLVIAGLLGWQLYGSILRFNAQNDLSKIRPVRNFIQKAAQEKSMPPLAPPKVYSAAEFSIIPEQNIFSDSRGKEDEVEAAPAPVIPPLTQKPILIGVTIVDNQRKAMIIDPTSTSQDRNRRIQIKRIGDVYRGYTITEISQERIVLESGTRREIIPLHEGVKRAQGGKTPIQSTRVVSFGGGGGSAGVVHSGSGGGGGSTRQPTVSSSAAQDARVSIQPGAAQSAVEQSRPASGTAAGAGNTPPPASRQTSPRTDSQGRQIIRTPFGDIVRPKRD